MYASLIPAMRSYYLSKPLLWSLFHLVLWAWVFFSPFQRFTKFCTWASMTHKTFTDKFEVIWWNYSCKLLSCLLVTRLHQNWHKNSMTDLLETKLPKASSSFLWSLYGLFSRFWASFLVYLLFPKYAKPTKKLCKYWSFLSTNLKPSSMRRTSRSWTWCSASHSSRWFSSRLTNQFREISIRYSKE